MAETRRNFRSTTPPRTAARPAPETPPADKGGEEKGDFVNVSSFFPSKSGKAETFFVKPEMIEKFQDIREGDIVGISSNAKSGRTMLWFIRKG